MSESINLHINGRVHHLETDPETSLLYVLRNDLGLKGVKYGCGSEQCGVCKVLVDGQAVPTCKLPVKNVVGAQIITVEGLGTPENLHPLQEAFREAHGLQCGFCTAGFLMTLVPFLESNPKPTADEIREVLAGNLCRCTGYLHIVDAVKLAAEKMAAGRET